MKNDAVSRAHPAVSLAYFGGAAVLCAVTEHPIYLAAGVLSGALYFLLLKGRSGFVTVLHLLMFSGIIALVNPLVNTRGETVLFSVFSRPYTAEALFYGAVVSGIFVATALWIGCAGIVITEEKLIYLFAGAPSLSLLFTMSVRLVPMLSRSAARIGAARRAIGCGANSEKKRARLIFGLDVLGALASAALEDSAAVGASMRSRGYGSADRTCFAKFRFTKRDAAFCFVGGSLFAACLCCILSGCAKARFYPSIDLQSIGGKNLAAFFAYTFYLLIPSGLHIKEEITWSLSK